jgi:hypothetical protein
MARKLGKHLGVVEDPRTLSLADYVQAPLAAGAEANLPLPPKTIHRTHRRDWEMFANDEFGDCTVAEVGNYLIAVSKDRVRLTDEQILAGYAKVCPGFDPETGENDNGAYMLDVMRLWRREGIGGHTVKAFVSVPLTRPYLSLAVYLFGGCLIGLRLPISAASQEIWDVPEGGLHGPGKPGSWGGHAVPLEDAFTSGGNVVTWGERQRCTWDFLHAYCDEAYAVVAPEWYPTGSTPDGFNEAQLLADLAALGKR